MQDHPYDAFKKRQAQWDTFHHWESSRADRPLSLEERLDWYCAASRFSLSVAPPVLSQHIVTRVKEIQEARERLAHLKRALRDG